MISPSANFDAPHINLLNATTIFPSTHAPRRDLDPISRIWRHGADWTPHIIPSSPPYTIAKHVYASTKDHERQTCYSSTETSKTPSIARRPAHSHAFAEALG